MNIKPKIQAALAVLCLLSILFAPQPTGLYAGTGVGMLASEDGETALDNATHGRGMYSALNALVVNTLDDELNTDGDCSLREAITAANTNAAVDACAAGNGADTITFSVDGTITLGSNLPFINDTLTIDGAGRTITVSGNNSVRVLVVNSDKTLSLSALTIANGNCGTNCDGGGIYNNGTLNVTHGAFYSNTATNTGGGIINKGTLTVTHSTFYSNMASVDGGGIRNSGTLTVAHSTFYSNTASYSGGGIHNSGTLTVAHSTFYSNTAIFGGGGINSGRLTMTHSTFDGNTASYGGGIFNSNNGTLTVTNSTFTGNSAVVFGGGILTHLNSTMTVTNSTITGSFAPNGSGVSSLGAGATATLYNTIVSGNTGGGGDCGTSSGGTLTANSNNLDSDGSCNDATQKTVAEINLGPLADNGGATPTMALLAGSAARDAGENARCPAADQRGIARPDNTTCDVGAYEYAPAPGPNFIVNSLADPGGDGFCDLANCTLREAIDAANAANGANTITFSVNGTITLGSTLPHIDDTLTIDGAGRTIAVSGNNSVQVLVVNGGQSLNLNALTIANGNCTACDGGGIANFGALTVTHSTFYSNTASYAGGIINWGRLTVTHSTFYSNTASNGSGGIDNNATLVVMNSTFHNNATPANGGGIGNSGTLTVTNSTFSGNSANTNGGGGLYTYANYTTTLYNTVVAHSTGGDCTSDGTLTANSNNLDTDGTCDNAFQDAGFTLGPLANNGGATWTMALLFNGSARAINQGDSTFCPATDQRGVARPFGPHCDVGAFELEYQLLFLPMVRR